MRTSCGVPGALTAADTPAWIVRWVPVGPTVKSAAWAGADAHSASATVIVLFMGLPPAVRRTFGSLGGRDPARVTKTGRSGTSEREVRLAAGPGDFERHGPRRGLVEDTGEVAGPAGLAAARLGDH